MVTDHSLTRLAWSLCALALFILALSLPLILLGWSTPLPRGLTPWRDQAVSLAGLVGAPILGGLIAAHRPHNPYGWLWLGFGLGLSLQLLAASYRAYALVETGTLVAPQEISHLLSLGGPLALSLAPFLLLLFPTGRLPSRRWRPVARISAFSGAMLLFLSILFRMPDKVGGAITIITIVVVFAIFATIIFSTFSLVARYRRSSGVERQQLKWFALAAVVAAFYIVGMLFGINRLLGSTLWHLFDTATNFCLYAAVGIAILRYRLYDIDIIINRTLVYGLLTAMLALVYFGGVVTTEAIFHALTGQEKQPQLAIVVSTLVIAALFNPLRRRIQLFIDRRFYRHKYDARMTLETFSAKLRDETDLEALNSELVGVIKETMQPEHVSLWFRPPDEAKE